MAGLGMRLTSRCRLLAWRRWLQQVRSPLAVGVLLMGGGLVGEARGQNDWQYPDPYFGILEIEKSHDAATRRRYRAEVSPAPRRDATTAPANQSPANQSPANQALANQSPTNQAPSPRPNRFRWRTRTRR
jgi:hypothetical protein